jgi:hypothetical protein
VALALGAAALLTERPPRTPGVAGRTYPWAVLAVGLTAVGLVAYDPGDLWWLVLLALLAYGLAQLGRIAHEIPHSAGWVRLYAHGTGGSYIALVTATLVVSLDGVARTLAWFAPTLVGVALIEWRVLRLRAQYPTIGERDDQLGAQGRAPGR